MTGAIRRAMRAHALRTGRAQGLFLRLGRPSGKECVSFLRRHGGFVVVGGVPARRRVETDALPWVGLLRTRRARRAFFGPGMEAKFLAARRLPYFPQVP